eukprot:NODE_30134_length_426_cov_6.889632.p2 GENE.NODE_30134_length_426_cov_6.889632~~NODE_30134_length_426_cov_6.889632.p2  ORF type:complete len:104 (+),score=40.63 NODE_30134_length_426_cov_6.889632:1-312(+)
MPTGPIKKADPVLPFVLPPSKELLRDVPFSALMVAALENMQAVRDSPGGDSGGGGACDDAIFSGGGGIGLCGSGGGGAAAANVIAIEEATGLRSRCMMAPQAA